MSFLDSLKSLLGGRAERDQGGHQVYVRCRRCGEVIHTRIDLHNELSQRDEGGYMVKKTLVGSQRCFERIEVALMFDENRRLVDRQIVHGDFITAEEFEAAQSS